MGQFVEAGTVEFVAAVADHGIDPQIGGYAGEDVRVRLPHGEDEEEEVGA